MICTVLLNLSHPPNLSLFITCIIFCPKMRQFPPIFSPIGLKMSCIGGLKKLKKLPWYIGQTGSIDIIFKSLNIFSSFTIYHFCTTVLLPILFLYVPLRNNRERKKQKLLKNIQIFIVFGQMEYIFREKISYFHYKCYLLQIC